MSFVRSELNPVEQIRELNRVFLTFLKHSAIERTDCLGLPDAARRALRSADDVLLDLVAEFPRALFRLALTDGPPAQVGDPLQSRLDSARHAIQLTIALCAWTLSRQSVYQARLLLALDLNSIQRLRGLALGDVQRLADIPRLVRCAFPDRAWLWTELLTETRPEARRQLLLVALQPGLDRDWPRRAPSLR